jgi:beta-porphyranase
MTRILILSAAMATLCVSAAVAEPPSPPEGMKWVLIPELSDEFNEATLDTSKWQLRFESGWAGRPPCRFTASNVSVGEGVLILRTTSGIKRYDDVADLDNDIWINCAVVASAKPAASYGYYEARIRASSLPTTSNFWMYGKSSEIDITEDIGRSAAIPSATYTVRSNTHYFPRGETLGGTTETTTESVPISTSITLWHTYGVWWKDAHSVCFYVDGVKVGEQTMKTAFTEQMFINFDTEWLTRYGVPDLNDMADAKKNGMYIDWIRFYHLAPKE